MPAGSHKTYTENVRADIQYGTVRGTGGQGRCQQQGCQGSEIQGDEGRTRETGEVRETDEEGGRTDSGQKPPGSRQCAYTGESTRECRPVEGNRGEDKGGRHGNEPGKPLRPDGTRSTAGTFCTAATATLPTAGIHTGNGTEKSATATSATAGTAADIHAETVTTDAGTGSARTAETTTGIHAASATARNMAVATTAATAAGKTADTATRAIRTADRRTAAFPTSISAAA